MVLVQYCGVIACFGFKALNVDARAVDFSSDPRPRRGRHGLAPRDPSDPATLPTLGSVRLSVAVAGRAASLSYRNGPSGRMAGPKRQIRITMVLASRSPVYLYVRRSSRLGVPAEH